MEKMEEVMTLKTKELRDDQGGTRRREVSGRKN